MVCRGRDLSRCYSERMIASFLASRLPTPRNAAARRTAPGIRGAAGFILAGLSLIMGSIASAQPEESLEVRSLAASCAACHGTEGRSEPGSSIPSLAHLPQPQFMARMRRFREDDALASHVMAQIAKGYDEQQLAQLAAYFASLP